MNVKEEEFDANMEYAAEAFDMAADCFELAQGIPAFGVFFSVTGKLIKQAKEVLELEEELDKIKRQLSMDVDFIACILAEDISKLKSRKTLYDKIVFTLTKLSSLLEEVQELVDEVVTQQDRIVSNTGNTMVSVIKSFMFGVKGSGDKTTSVKKLRNIIDRNMAMMTQQVDHLKGLLTVKAAFP